MQPTELPNLFDARTKIEVIGVAEKNLDTEFLEHILRHTLDRGNCANRHKDRCFYLAVWSGESAGARGACSSLNKKREGHFSDCSGCITVPSYARPDS